MGIFVLQQVLRMNLPLQFSLVAKLGALAFTEGESPCLTTDSFEIPVLLCSCHC